MHEGTKELFVDARSSEGREDTRSTSCSRVGLGFGYSIQTLASPLAARPEPSTRLFAAETATGYLLGPRKILNNVNHNKFVKNLYIMLVGARQSI